MADLIPYAILIWTGTFVFCAVALGVMWVLDTWNQPSRGRARQPGGMDDPRPPAVIYPLDMYRDRRTRGGAA